MNEEKDFIGYKIVAGKDYMVFRSEYNGKIFYNIQVSKKNYDGTKEVAYKSIRFKQGVDVPDRTIIIPKAGFEDFYKKDKYTTIFTLVITDFEIKENKELDKSSAIEEYNNAVSESDIEITDDMLPF